MGENKDQKTELVLKGRCIVPGMGEGSALVLKKSISAFGGIDPYNSNIIESRHPQKGKKVRKKVLIFPNGKGSSGFSLYFHIMSITNNAPNAMIINKINSLTALAAVAGNIPTVGGPFEMNKNAVEHINTGDRIRVEATKGLVLRVIS